MYFVFLFLLYRFVFLLFRFNFFFPCQWELFGYILIWYQLVKVILLISYCILPLFNTELCFLLVSLFPLSGLVLTTSHMIIQTLSYRLHNILLHPTPPIMLLQVMIHLSKKWINEIFQTMSLFLISLIQPSTLNTQTQP